MLRRVISLIAVLVTTISLSGVAFADNEPSYFDIPFAHFEISTENPDGLISIAETRALVEKVIPKTKIETPSAEETVKGPRLTLKERIKQRKLKYALQKPIQLAEFITMLLQSDDLEKEVAAKSIEELLVTGRETSVVVPENLAIDAEYSKNIIYALSQTFLGQRADTTILAPDHEMTRGEVALILYRFLRIQDGKKFGNASWYGDGLSKRKLEKNADLAAQYLTAASRVLPMGTKVHVTNMFNGNTVDVVINDRGPYITGRILDLSKTAFSKLTSPGAGVASVMVEVLSDEQ